MTKKNYKKIVFILSIAITALTVAAIALTVLLALIGPKSGLFGHKKNDVSDFSPVAALPESADRGEFYIKNMIFVGDSVTLAMKEHQVLSNGKNTTQIWCGEGGDLALDYNIDKTAILYPESGLAISIPEAAKQSKPSCMVISIGISNGVPYCTEDAFKEYYTKLVKGIQKASPDTRIILQSVFPTSKIYQKDNSEITNEKIAEANLWISEIALDCSVRYLDTYSILTDEKGYLNEKYDSGDGLRLNAEGYKAVLYYIRTHGYK